ncbi:class E sortase [Nakamurella leprariae]|uniref:Class E sortase n=1 Tax=Nakamurella leprariae TaxID=2803911 RepID=A0A939C2U6_9ACTN|nr:class E sortase [Nakamurella leprariae]MBM9468462.1 class E sortase [Nakamurella leprariae]
MTVDQLPPAPAGSPPPARPGAGRTLIRGLGQLLITAGVVVLLFVVYEIWVTDLFGAQKQAAATEEVDEAWAAAAQTQAPQTDTVVVTDPAQLVTDPRERTPTYQTLTGQGFAKISIPAFGADYQFTIVEGTSDDDLYVGPGHYPESQMPGEQGNFAVAGHRVSKGSPFNDLGLLNSCDSVIIETQDDWFVYRVLPMPEEIPTWSSTAPTRPLCADVSVLPSPYEQTVGREITLPSDYAQILPVPGISDATVPADAQRLITLTTCHPQFSAAERMIVHGVLTKSYAKAPGFLPPEMGEA